jgi:hypothetical protein
MILTFPYHDPEGKFNHVFQRQLETLKSTFDAICVSAISPTPTDNSDFVQYLITTCQVDWLTWEDPYWERVAPDALKRCRENSQAETIKRLRWNVPLMLLLTEDRFRPCRPTR